MEVEQSFQTPATRRSPAQFEKTTETQLDLNEQKSKGRKGKGNNENMNEELKEKNNNNEKSNSHSIVTKAFEALKPYYRDGLSNNMAWLTDDVCEDAANNLGIVMPPIGYECTMRTFRSSKDVYKDPARDNGYNYDIYNKNDTIYDENDNAIHQGTISMTEENVDSKEDINIINEFGFGYRNGYVFNEKNDITPNGLLYIKHKSEKNLFDSLNNNNNNDRSQNDNKSKPYYYYSDRRRTDDKVGGVGDDDHEYDSIKDVTAKTTGGRIRHNGGGFHHTHLRKNIHGAAMEISDGDQEEEEDNYDVMNNDNDNDNSGNSGFAFTTPLFNETQSQGQEAQEEEEDTKMNGNKPPRRSTTTVTTTKIGTTTTTRLPSSESSTKGGGWMSRYPIFGRTTDGGSSANDGFKVAETPIQSPAPGRNSQENRRESLVSEYSNYTPDGIQRHANRRTLKN